MTVNSRDAAADGFARSESGRTQFARRVWARDGPQQRTGMYLPRVLKEAISLHVIQIRIV